MTSINKKRMILLLSLLMSILVLLKIIFNDKDYSVDNTSSTSVNEKFNAETLSGINQIDFGSMDAYESIVQRPLFVIGRNVVTEEKEVVQKGSLEVPDLVLIGVVITPDSESAMLSDNKTKKYFTLKSGDEFKGWKLNEILKDKVVFSAKERSHELLLHAEETKQPIKRSRPLRK